MKIALINPPGDSQIYHPWVPLGLLYLGTILRGNGFTIKILDAAALQYDADKILRWIKQFKPDMVGFTVFTMSFLATMDIIKVLRQWNPSLRIALGHYHATIESENIIKKYGAFVDFCIRGEGEYTFLALCEFLESHPDMDPVDIRGITYRNKNGDVVSTPDAPLIIDIDKIPFPDRTLVDFDYKWSFNGLEFTDSKFTSSLSSRGCPLNCSFCGCSSFAKQRWRPRSPENIVAELQQVQDQGITELTFVDDNFTMRPKRVIQICELMKKERIDINWHTDGRVDQTNQNMLNWMHKAGCWSIWYGFESANQRILDLFNKKSKVSQFDVAIRKARKARIEIIVGLFMLGAPTETYDEVLHTVRYALKSDIEVPFFNVVEVYSGIKLWNDCVAQGLITPHDKVMVKTGGNMREVERWETTTNVMEITLPPEQRARILDLIQAG